MTLAQEWGYTQDGTYIRETFDGRYLSTVEVEKGQVARVIVTRRLLVMIWAIKLGEAAR